jgi:hypothetical protein
MGLNSRYEIRVKGILDGRWTAWFEDLHTRESSGRTPGPPGAPGPASRTVHPTRASGQRDAQLQRFLSGRKPAVGHARAAQRAATSGDRRLAARAPSW